MPLRRLPLLLTSAAALLWPTARALTVDVTPVHRLHAKPSPRESLEQVWAVAASTPSDAIASLHIDALCQVVVSYALQDTPDLLATVRVSGSDFKLITAADVVASLSPKTLAIRHQDAASHLRSVDGFVGIEVLLHQPHTLQRLNVTGDGDVVVRECVLVESVPEVDVSITASGSGAVYLPPELAISANSISLSTNGSASLYLPTAAMLNASIISFRQSGRGAIAAISAVLAASVTIAVTSSGSGAVCIDATFVQTNAIKVHATSTGDVYVGGHDGAWAATHRYYCDVAQVFQSGAGSVDVGTIVCIDTDVELYGSGNVTVASARSLGGHSFGAGKILFAGDSPVDVLAVDPWAYLKQPIAHRADAYQPTTCTVATAPPRALSRIEREEAGSTMHHILTPARAGVVALLALCIGAAYLAETRRQRDVRSHTRRGEHTPLLAGGGGRESDAASSL